MGGTEKAPWTGSIRVIERSDPPQRLTLDRWLHEDRAGWNLLRVALGVVLFAVPIASTGLSSESGHRGSDQTGVEAVSVH